MNDKMTENEIAAKIRAFGKKNEPFIFESEEIAMKIYALLDKKKYKISGAVIWKIA